MKLNETIIIIAELIVIILGLFVSYQILRIIFGGSWTLEKTILTIVTINATGMFATLGLVIKAMINTSKLETSTTKGITKLTSDVEHLTADVRELKTDFKTHTKQFNTLTTDFEVHLEQHRKN